MTGMENVLAAHQFNHKGAVCTCSNEVQVGLPCDAQTHPQHVAEVLTAAGYRKPRQITTVEELKTVYAGCLIRDSGGDLWSVDGATDRLFMIVDGADDTYDDDDLTLPATVLYEPLP